MALEAEVWFDHEKLEVYREAILYIAWQGELLESIARGGEVKDQLERAASSIALNIAEGNGKFSTKDRCRFLDIAYGSTLECAAGLDVLVARTKASPTQIRPGKERLKRIVRMLVGLLKHHSERDYSRKQADPPVS